MSLSKSIFKNVLAQIAGRLYTSLISFLLIMVLLARILSAEEFGVFNFYMTLYYIFITIIDFGANTIAVREASKDLGRLPGLLRALVRLRAAAALVCLLVVCGAAVAFEPVGDFRLLVFLASLHLLSYSLGGYNVVFHVKMLFGYVAFISGLGHTVFLALSAAFYFAGSTNPAHYLIAYGLGMAVTNVANFILSRPFLPAGEAGSGPGSVRLFREALPLGISSVMVTIYFYVDTVLLRILTDEAQVGYYNAAYRILTFSLMIPVLFNQVIFPVYSRYFGEAGGELARLKPVFRRAVLYMGITGVPAGAALCIFSGPLIVAVCGEAFRVSAYCLAVLSLAMTAIFLTYPHISILVASGRQILFAWIAGAGGVANILLNLALIPRYGIAGAAWATVITETLVLCCAVACVWRYTRMTAWDRELYKIALTALVVAGASLLLRAIHPFVAVPLLGAGYLFLVFAQGLLPFDIHDEDRH